jgi:transposase
MKRNRRQYSAEFKAEAVRLTKAPGQSIAAVAKDLGIGDGLLRAWIRQAAIDSGNGQHGALTTIEKEELSSLRREVRQLRIEREILRKATAFFAKEQM